MKTRALTLGLLMSFTLGAGFVQAKGLANNPNTSPTIVGMFPTQFGTAYVCVTLPPGYGGVVNHGSQRALAAQGDEGLHVARSPYLSLDACATVLVPLADNDPLPHE